MKNKLLLYLLIAAIVLLVIGGLAAVFDLFWGYIVFSTGALLAIVHSFLYAVNNKTDDVRKARLQRLYFICTLFLGVAAWLMFIKNNAWVVMIIIFAVTTFFLSFRGKDND